MDAARVIAGICALIALAGIVLRNIAMAELNPEMGFLGALIDHTQYFTLWGSGAVALVAGAMALRPGAWLAGPQARLAAFTASTITGLVYAILLRYELADLDGLQKVASHALHDATPVVFALTWLLARHGELSWRSWGWVAILPLTYLATVLVRGLAPYWFLNIKTMGVLSYLGSVVGLTAAFIALALVAIGIDKGLARFAHRAGSG